MSTKVTDEMVSRFLSWPLPQDFYPDCYVAFDREKAVAGSWPTGTNLFTAEQARKMLEHVAQAPATSRVLTEHSGCGQGTQVDQLTVRLNPGDKVVLVMGPYSAAVAKSQSPD